jgi:serine protease AprX
MRQNMAKRKNGVRADVRQNALWGSGNRGGEFRSSALWGKGARGLGLTVVAMLALAVPLAGAKSGPKPGSGTGTAAYVAASLLEKAKQNPGQKISVIVQSTGGVASAEKATQGMGTLRKRLAIANAVALELPAARLAQLAKVPGLTITPDAPAVASGRGDLSSKVLWPYESTNAELWKEDKGIAAAMPTIAIVDSGIQQPRLDFGSRVLASVNLSTLDGNSPGDGRGHGTFVAGIAAGSISGLAGAAPLAKLVSIDVMDDRGMARTSDVIAACEWILANKERYDIRVANFSLHSATRSNFTHDPLDRAVEKLWFSGVVVVAAAGNYGNADGTPSGVPYAPGNDPFVITVGAIDINDTSKTWDDKPAPFTAFGYTHDGFWKPEVSAAGRYMVGPVPITSTIAADRAENVVAPGYIQLSGTSFAAPIVAGTAAQMLARHPHWTPDQVKGALMKRARKLDKGTPGGGGVGQISASKSAKWNEELLGTPPNPNAALNRFLTADPNGGSIPVFDAVSWTDVSWSDVSWDSVSWSDVSWSDVNWNAVSWSDVSWSDVSWSDVSWSDVSWSDVSWSDVSWEDAAEGDATSSDTLELSAGQADELLADPDLEVTADMLPESPALELIGVEELTTLP